MGRFFIVSFVLAALMLEIAMTVPTLQQKDDSSISRVNKDDSSISSRVKRDDDNLEDKIEDYANDVLDQMWGGKCLSDGECTEYIGSCHKDTVLQFGECRLEWWFILILALVAAFIICSLISCICCPCCFLYSCCQSICCCCGNSGYSMASRG
jgi:hypothetical protein